MYGWDWEEWQQSSDVEERFIAWLIEKGEEIPASRRPPALFPKIKASPAVDDTPQAEQPGPSRIVEPDIGTRLTLSMVDSFLKCQFKYYRSHVEGPRMTPKWVSLHLGLARYFRSIIAEAFDRIGVGATVESEFPFLNSEAARARFLEQFFPCGNLVPGYRLCSIERQETFCDKIATLVINLNRFVERELKGHTIVNFNQVFAIRDLEVPICGNTDLTTRHADGCIHTFIFRTGKKPRDFEMLDRMRLAIGALGVSREYKQPNVKGWMVYPSEADYWRTFTVIV